MAQEQPTVSVFAPVLYLTVTIERAPDVEVDEVHIHPGGQGFWIARMLQHIGERPLVCGPVGGEPGRVISSLLSEWDVDFAPVLVNHASSVVVYDRRSGERQVVARTDSPDLVRHEHDDVYGLFLEHALKTGVCVITGQIDELFPLETYRRLGHDLAGGEVRVVADMHGAELRAFLEGGPIEVLKVSTRDLQEDGWIEEESDEESLMAIERLFDTEARAVVLSRQNRPALARFGLKTLQAVPPLLEPADSRGAGDSMKAGLAAAVRRGLDPERSLRLASAAGAANITRRGLGSANESLVPQLEGKVEVSILDTADQ